MVLKSTRRSLIAALLGAASIGSAAAQVEFEYRPEAETDFGAWIKQCRDKFTQQDARIDAAGVRDAGFYRIPGFPYMRSDRLIAAFRHNVNSFESMGDWTAQLRENDTIARQVEFTNLGMTENEIYTSLNDLRVCAVWLTNIELEDPTIFKTFVEKVAVPNTYPKLRDAPEPNAGEAAVPAKTTVVRWHAKIKEDATQIPKDLTTVHRDNLGRIGLLMNVWRALVEKHAPEFAVETGGEHDRLGAMKFAGKQAAVATERPAVYYRPSFARAHDRTLVQLNYFLWFPARPAIGKADPEAGSLDSLIWRVTLDEQGKPLVYESIAGSGAHHRWYPAQAMKLQENMAKQVRVADQLAPPVVSVRIASGSHSVAALSARADEGAEAARQYELIDYDDLLLLPAAKGTRSLFGPDGVVAGSERKHGAKAWPTGFPKPGAIRQWGHHVVSFQQGSYFDDPLLLERTFDLPKPPEQTAVLRPHP